MILGVWVMVFLFLGLPSVWDKLLSLGVGLVIVLIATSFKPPMKTVSPDRVPYMEHRASPRQSTKPSDIPRDSMTVDTPIEHPITSTDSTVS